MLLVTTERLIFERAERFPLARRYYIKEQFRMGRGVKITL